MTSGTDGGIMMPSVPPAASAPVDRLPAYPARLSSGSVTWPIVAAVASELPQMAPKPAQAPIAAIAMPPFQWPMNARTQRNSAADSPPCVANCPISRNIGMTMRS